MFDEVWLYLLDFYKPTMAAIAKLRQHSLGHISEAAGIHVVFSYPNAGAVLGGGVSCSPSNIHDDSDLFVWHILFLSVNAGGQCWFS